MPALGFPHLIVSDPDSLSGFFPPLLPLLLRNMKRFRIGTSCVKTFFNWIFIFYWYAQVIFKWFTDVLPSTAYLTSFPLSLCMDSSNDTGKQYFGECAAQFCNKNPKWKARRHCHLRELMFQSCRLWHSVSNEIGGHPAPCRVGAHPSPTPGR